MLPIDGFGSQTAASCARSRTLIRGTHSVKVLMVLPSRPRGSACISYWNWFQLRVATKQRFWTAQYIGGCIFIGIAMVCIWADAFPTWVFINKGAVKVLVFDSSFVCHKGSCLITNFAALSTRKWCRRHRFREPIQVLVLDVLGTTVDNLLETVFFDSAKWSVHTFRFHGLFSSSTSAARSHMPLHVSAFSIHFQLYMIPQSRIDRSVPQGLGFMIECELNQKPGLISC